MSDELLVERDGPVLRVTFNRPAQRNALTWRMYADLANACEIADTDADVRVMVLRGAGDEAFVAGTDVSQFTEFRTGEEMHAIGFVAELCEEAELDARTTSVVDRLAAHAPLTMWAAKEATRRLRQANLPDGDDIVRTVYGSEDFQHGVASFLAKQKPRWQGR